MVGRNPGLLAMRPAQVRYYTYAILFDISQSFISQQLLPLYDKQKQ